MRPTERPRLRSNGKRLVQLARFNRASLLEPPSEFCKFSLTRFSGATSLIGTKPLKR
jgi:hypothetical protein